VCGTRRYFPEDFNGAYYTAVDAAARVADFGEDLDASQLFYDLPKTHEQVFIDLASSWEFFSESHPF
jgi:sucrose-6-phosphate hydrolase SacC (GH32 family)